MLLALYTSLFSLACLLGLPLLPLALLMPRLRAGLGERLGWLPKAVRRAAMVHEGSLWVHAASLGEVNAVAPVVRELLPRLPRLNLVLTCTTLAGREQARRLFPQAGACLLLPLDLPWLIRPWVRRFKPRLALIAETELWPNFLVQLKAHGVQVMLVNGRLTERSARRYALARGFFAGVLEQVAVFGMQSEADADRLKALGAPAARVTVTGNTKFDVVAEGTQALEAAEALRRALGWKQAEPVVVAGSTRPGEEGPLVAAWLELAKRFKGLHLVLAPRHLERTDEAAAALEKAGVKYARRSSLGKGPAPEALLLDSLGELKAFYALAAPAGLAWVGGSFVDHGGQNPLEPASLGVPLVFGPHMRHFVEPAAALLEAGAAAQAPVEGLAKASLALLEDAKARRAMAAAGQACVKERSGASRRSAELAWKLLLVWRMKRDGHVWRDEGLQQLRSVAEFGSGGDDGY